MNREQNANNMRQEAAQKEPMRPRTRNLLTLLALAIAALTVWVIVSQNRAFSWHDFMKMLRGAKPGWLAAAAGCMFLYIFSEAAAVATACRPFGPRIRMGRGLAYAASDIYFSAITPSATGGQPACAFFMMRDGISGMASTAALLANLAMYTLAIVVIGILILVCFPGVFLAFDLPMRLMVAIGLLIQIALTAFYVLLIKNQRLLERICFGVLRLLTALHLLRHAERKRQKLQRRMDEYGQCVLALQGERRMFLRVFLLNLAQRTAHIAVTACTALAAGAPPAAALRLWAIQGYAVLGSNFIPIPGAMGVADYLMLRGFQVVLTAQAAASLELLSRSISFYICIVFCGILTFADYLLHKSPAAESRHAL